MFHEVECIIRYYCTFVVESQILADVYESSTSYWKVFGRTNRLAAKVCEIQSVGGCRL